MLGVALCSRVLPAIRAEANARAPRGGLAHGKDFSFFRLLFRTAAWKGVARESRGAEDGFEISQPTTFPRFLLQALVFYLFIVCLSVYMLPFVHKPTSKGLGVQPDFIGKTPSTVLCAARKIIITAACLTSRCRHLHALLLQQGAAPLRALSRRYAGRRCAQNEIRKERVFSG